MAVFELELDFDYEAASDAFYSKLFSLFPEIQSRFQNVHAQKQMFEIALKTVIKHRKDNNELDHYLGVLGEKHKMMGVQPMHMTRGYAAFVEAIKAGHAGISDQEIASLTEIFKKLVITMGYDEKRLRF